METRKKRNKPGAGRPKADPATLMRTINIPFDPTLFDWIKSKSKGTQAKTVRQACRLLHWMDQTNRAHYGVSAADHRLLLGMRRLLARLEKKEGNTNE